MGIVRLNELPEGSGSLTNDDIFVFMDDPSGSGITKKISLSQISAAIGGGGGGGTNLQITTVDLHNGGVQDAQVLKFDNPSYQSVITGPTPTENSNAQRLIIQGHRGSGTGEGGDVYVWGGDSDSNGGDIKIYAGDADSNESGQGGYINIDAGNGFSQGGNIDITAGNGGVVEDGFAVGTAGMINIKAGTGAVGGNVTIRGGDGWGTSGGNVEIYGGAGAESGGSVAIYAAGNYAGDGNISLFSANGSSFIFDNNGLTFKQTSQIVGGETNSGDGNNKGTIELVPDVTLKNNDQYLIIDPTGPNHVHLRAGGTIDGSSAELIVGGEYAHVNITDYNHQVSIRADGGETDTTINLGQPLSPYGDNAFATEFIPPYGSTITVGDTTYTVSGSWDNTHAGEDKGITLSPSTPILEYGTYTIHLASIPKSWTFQNDGNLNIPGNILLNNGTSVAIGTFDNNTGGNNGISLNCAVGYQLNWQGGHLKSTLIGDNAATTIHVDSSLNLNAVSLTAKSSSITINGLIHIGYEDNIEGSVENLYFTTQSVQNLGIGWKVDTGNGTLLVLNIYPHTHEGNEGTALALTPIASWPPSLGGETANFYCTTTVNGNGLTFPDGSVQNTAATGGGGLSDSNTYIICKTGDDLAAKYAAAKVLTPGGNALSSTNRATLIVMPGNYSLSEELEIDAEFVDILGLGSMKLDRGCVTAVTLLNYTINVTANDVRVKGISVGTQSFKIGNDLPLQIIEDCIGGDNSFGSATIVSGVFVNCLAGATSFGATTVDGIGIASGTFINCISEHQAFGGGGAASGTFKNCVGLTNSFGGNGGTCSGFFEHCTGGDSSFGGEGGTLSGTLLQCRLTSGTFPTLSGSGKIRLCIDGNYDVVNADPPPEFPNIIYMCGITSNPNLNGEWNKTNNINNGKPIYQKSGGSDTISYLIGTNPDGWYGTSQDWYGPWYPNTNTDALFGTWYDNSNGTSFTVQINPC